jgi:hypothetical protein
VWVWWVLGGLIAWFVVALAGGVVIGRGIRLADRKLHAGSADNLTIAALYGHPGAVPQSVRQRRRPIPLPPIGIGLAALAVLLEGVGFVDRLTGETSRALSMDAPYSLPRMYVAAVFAAAALAAVAGAGSIPGRRTWWTATGLVAAVIAGVKAGGTVHADAMNELASAAGPIAAVSVSALLAAGVVAWLWFLSRHERRDRRRVLGSLAGYAFAAVVLSAVSGLAPGSWAAGATFVEESGEALGAVAFLIAVLAGVAPRLVLPAGWPLRRSADAHTLDAAQHAPVRPRTTGTG